MNARQAAKIYKRRYLEMANAPVIPKIMMTPHPVTTLVTRRVFSEREIYKDDAAVTYAIGKMASELGEQAVKEFGEVITQDSPVTGEKEVRIYLTVMRRS